MAHECRARRGPHEHRPSRALSTDRTTTAQGAHSGSNRTAALSRADRTSIAQVALSGTERTTTAQGAHSGSNHTSGTLTRRPHERHPHAPTARASPKPRSQASSARPPPKGRTQAPTTRAALSRADRTSGTLTHPPHEHRPSRALSTDRTTTARAAHSRADRTSLAQAAHCPLQRPARTRCLTLDVGIEQGDDLERSAHAGL
jgi:hypothetical protein